MLQPLFFWTSAAVEPPPRECQGASPTSRLPSIIDPLAPAARWAPCRRVRGMKSLEGRYSRAPGLLDRPQGGRQLLQNVERPGSITIAGCTAIRHGFGHSGSIAMTRSPRPPLIRSPRLVGRARRIRSARQGRAPSWLHDGLLTVMRSRPAVAVALDYVITRLADMRCLPGRGNAAKAGCRCPARRPGMARGTDAVGAPVTRDID